MRISSPPTKWPCYYGIDTPTRAELIASTHSVEETNQYLTSDSLAYLPLEAMHRAVIEARGATVERKPKSLPVINGSGSIDSFCTACWSGDYPVEFTPPPRARQMHLLDL